MILDSSGISVEIVLFVKNNTLLGRWHSAHTYHLSFVFFLVKLLQGNVVLKMRNGLEDETILQVDYSLVSRLFEAEVLLSRASLKAESHFYCLVRLIRFDN